MYKRQAVDHAVCLREGRAHEPAHVAELLVSPSMPVHDGAGGGDDAGHGVDEGPVEVENDELPLGYRGHLLFLSGQVTM